MATDQAKSIQLLIEQLIQYQADIAYSHKRRGTFGGRTYWQDMANLDSQHKQDMSRIKRYQK